MKPGRGERVDANSAVMVENAMPIRTLRPSRGTGAGDAQRSDARLVIGAMATLDQAEVLPGRQHQGPRPRHDDDDEGQRDEQREGERRPWSGIIVREIGRGHRT